MREESERVAERVRNLLEQHGRAAPDEPGRSPAPAGRSRVGRWARLRARVAVRVPVRIDPGRRAALGVGIAVAVASVLTGAWVLAARPSSLPVSSSAAPGVVSSPARTPFRSAAPAPVEAPGSPTPTPAAVVVVDVAGRVRHPGVYRLPVGARVDDALRAAGGALAGVHLDALNLAAKLADGQQVAVGIAPAAGVAGPGASAAGPGPTGGGGGLVDLNTATLDQLQTLPGVGPVLAQHILDWRSQHGRFTSVDQLDDVTGIGDVKFAALKPLVST